MRKLAGLGGLIMSFDLQMESFLFTRCSIEESDLVL